MIYLKALAIILIIQAVYAAINDNYCGKPLLTSGDDFTEGDYDLDKIGWVANVYRKKDNGWVNNNCIANIISEYWLLSAASCLPMKTENYRIHITKDSTVKNIDKIVKYSRYNPTVGAGYDMALIKLKSALSFEMENVRPICLTDVEPESNVGWLIYHNTTNEKQLTMVKTQSINGIQCLEKFGTKIFNNNYMYCEDHSLCKTADGQMNNGAPIAIKVQLSDSSKYYLAAMASWPQHCDQDRDAVVGSTVDAFTKLCYKPYYQWIADTTQH